MFNNPRQSWWLSLLILVNFIIPIFFYNRLEAQAVFFSICFAFVLGLAIFKTQGFTRFLGLMHFHWFLLIFFLSFRFVNAQNKDFFWIWIASVIIVNSISLVFDVKDVFLYIKGQRSSVR